MKHNNNLWTTCKDHHNLMVSLSAKELLLCNHVGISFLRSGRGTTILSNEKCFSSYHSLVGREFWRKVRVHGDERALVPHLITATFEIVSRIRIRLAAGET